MRNSGIFHPARLRALCLALLLLVCVSAPWRASADAPQVLDTKYFTILYPHGEEKAAAWYAGFADDVDSAVSDMLGSEPVAGLKLHIYATEAEYTGVNPAAEAHTGIMAHAVPELKEVGVAVERLRQMPPELARESFRHEMTHIVVGVLSNNKLPVGFQEGLAQYNELSTTRGQEVATLLRAAESSGQKYLTWDQLNDRAVFSQNLELSYPQSYSIMAFLAEKYGMSAYGHFLKNLRSNTELHDALAWGFGAPIDKLEAEWRLYMPGFLKDGWRLNLFQAYDLAPAQALYDAGRYKEAQDAFTRSERLYRDLGKTAKADEIAALVAKSTRAQGATDLNSQALAALKAHDYAHAKDTAGKAGSTYSDLKLSTTQGGTGTGTVAGMAAQGLRGVELLASARKHLDGWDLAASEREAKQAGEALAPLGDDARVAEANSVLSSVWFWRQLAGFSALGLGFLAVLLGAVAFLRARRRNRLPAQLPRAEENRSWL